MRLKGNSGCGRDGDGVSNADRMHKDADRARIRRRAIWQPRYPRILNPSLRLNHPAPRIQQSRRPVALRPHLSVGLPKNLSQYA
jgi:hypothetical protein